MWGVLGVSMAIFASLAAAPVPAGAGDRQLDATRAELPDRDEIPRVATPRGIAAASDGTIWFTSGGRHGRIGRITADGAVSTFTDPNDNVWWPRAIEAGADGNLWFVDVIGAIGYSTRDGVITTFASGTVHGIVAGPRGQVWFTASFGDSVGSITAGGRIRTHSIRDAHCSEVPFSIAVDSQGNLWTNTYTSDDDWESTCGFARVTAQGAVSIFEASNVGDVRNEWDMATGPDGNVWFTDQPKNRVGRITPAGDIRSFPAGEGCLEPDGITAGPDANLWFTCRGSDRIAQITPQGNVTLKIPVTRGCAPTDITAAPDGNLWFTCHDSDRIGRSTPTGTTTYFPPG